MLAAWLPGGRMHFLSEGAVTRSGLPRTDTFLSPLRDQLGRFDARTGRGRSRRFSVVGRTGAGDGPAGLGADLDPEEVLDTTTPRTGLRQWSVRSASWPSTVLRERCRRHMAREVWWLCWRRTWLRVAARLAWESSRAPGREPLPVDRWIGAELEVLAGEQREEVRAAVPWHASRDHAFYRTLGRALRVSPPRARALCVCWNALPIDERRRLWAEAAGAQEKAVVSQGR